VLKRFVMKKIKKPNSQIHALIVVDDLGYSYPGPAAVEAASFWNSSTPLGNFDKVGGSSNMQPCSAAILNCNSIFDKNLPIVSIKIIPNSKYFLRSHRIG
jgi:hypothetical protein